MSCDFRVGDEVVCISGQWMSKAPGWMFWARTRDDKGPAKGDVLVVERVFLDRCDIFGDMVVWLKFATWPKDSYDAVSFRKVQKRDIGEWLKTAVKDTDKLDKGAPKRRVRV